MDEMEVVWEMLEKARKYHLEVEVIVEYSHNIKAGYAPEIAASAALYEWDLV
jgi:hypothetical protein